MAMVIGRFAAIGQEEGHQALMARLSDYVSGMYERNKDTPCVTVRFSRRSLAAMVSQLRREDRRKIERGCHKA
jgi:hypothetical protein